MLTGTRPSAGSDWASATNCLGPAVLMSSITMRVDLRNVSATEREKVVVKVAADEVRET